MTTGAPLRLPLAHVVLLSAQDARIATKAVEEAVGRHLDELDAGQAATIARQLRAAQRAALLTAIRLDRHAATLATKDPP